MNVLVTVDKFGKEARQLLGEVCSTNHTIYYNSIEKRLSKEELSEAINTAKPEIIIAGTEAYDTEILDLATKLKVISRVGIGLDSVDLKECEARNITVESTPDAPSDAVAELTLGQILNAIRRIQEVDMSVRKNGWFRYVGKDLKQSTVGIIGYGRIGSRVANMLKGLCKDIYIHEIDDTKNIEFNKLDLNYILTNCDIITFHIPFNSNNKNLITYKELDLLKKDCILINTSRGGIIHEQDLYDWLVKNEDAIAAIDVFEQEPYSGNLTTLTNCYLTPHLGSCTIKSRRDMEVGAVENITKYL